MRTYVILEPSRPKKEVTGLVPATRTYEQISRYEVVALAASPQSSWKSRSYVKDETRVPLRLSRLPVFHGSPGPWIRPELWKLRRRQCLERDLAAFSRGYTSVMKLVATQGSLRRPITACCSVPSYTGSTRLPKKSCRICQAANSMSNYYPIKIQPLVWGKVNIKVFTSAPNLERLCADDSTRDSCQCQAAGSPASRARRVSRCNILPTQQSIQPHHRIAVAMWYCSVAPVIRFR